MMAEAFLRCYYDSTLENNKSFHAQFIFEKPTNSAFSVSVIARCIGDNVPGELGCRPK